jgi:hypothetical protein
MLVQQQRNEHQCDKTRHCIVVLSHHAAFEHISKRKKIKKLPLTCFNGMKFVGRFGWQLSLYRAIDCAL